MFDGLLIFGGIELVNAERTTAYINNLMPGFPLVRRTHEYETIHVALEEPVYRSPFLDSADWVETDDGDEQVQRNPSHSFYGLYPLSIEGIGDSTMTAPVVEGILDGGSVGSERDSTREIRVRGLLIGADRLAVEAGLTWLRNALRANGCGMHGDLCGYQDLRYFLAKPEVCDPLWAEIGEDENETFDVGGIDVATTPLVWTHGVEGQPHLYRWIFPTNGIDGVKISWGALAFDGAEVLETDGPVFLRRSNFIVNPRIVGAPTPLAWSMDNAATFEFSDDWTFVAQLGGVPVLRTNWLPEPSFENGDPESFGWRSNTVGGITAVVDGTAPEGTRVAVVAANLDGCSIEATMLGPALQPYIDSGMLCFWIAQTPDDLVIEISDNEGNVIESYIIDAADLTDPWQRIEQEVLNIQQGYVVRLRTAGTAELRVDGFLLDQSYDTDYFDGDTPDAGTVNYYYVGSSPSGASRTVDTAGLETFAFEGDITDAPPGPAVLSFYVASPESDGTLLVELLDENDVVVSSTVIAPTAGGSRFALGADFGRRVRPRFTSSNLGLYLLGRVMLEAGSELGDYFDGDSTAPTDYTLGWVGGPGNSISRMTWTGSTEISMDTNFRPFLDLIQGSMANVQLYAEWANDIAMDLQLRDYDRTYHRVSATVGVKRIRDLTLDTGAATEVDFILTAATPFAFSTQSEPIPFFPLDPAPIYTEDDAINLVPNPSAETATTGFTAVPGTTGVAAVTNPTSTTAYGVKVARCTWSTASTAAGGGMYIDVPVVAGYTYSFLAYHVKSSITNRLQFSIEWRTSIATISTVTDAEFVATAATVYGKGLGNQLAPATATVARIKVLSVAGTSYANWSIASYLELDGLLAVFGSAEEITYFDGSTADTDAYDYSWEGTTGTSASRRTVHVDTQSPLIDPDLPVIPAPPTAPAIEDEAITDQNEWLRYYIEIPAGDVALWAKTVPTLTLYTLTEDVRQVRVRVTPNPFGWEHGDLDTANYCAEFLLSYLPANSTITVDSVTRQAWASVAGGEPQPANQLLYGTDGAPMTWPDLDCQIPYLMTIDILPTADIANLTVDLAVSRRE